MLKFRTAALTAAAVVGLAAFAGAQTPAKPDSAHRGMRHAGQMDGKHHGRMAGRRDGGRKMMADLKLTDAQKTRIKAIHEKYAPQMKAMREQGKTQFKALRDARQKGDTSAAARARFKAQREQFMTRSQSIRQQEQNEVRGVFTAEQRSKWDAAAKERKARFEARKDEMKERRDARVRKS
jgi:Spy/CpxP family protein refolding chaperone